MNFTSSGIENRGISNFSPMGGAESRGGAIGETMGVSSNRGAEGNGVQGM